MDFVLVQQGKALGPFSPEKVRAEIKAGNILKSANIWRPPWDKWVAVTELFPLEFGLTGNLFTEMENRGEIRHKPEEDMFERVQRQVPASKIADLLREAKGRAADSSDVKITSTSKEDLVYENLRDAVSKGLISKKTVEAMIQEAEETGGQRIFLFRLKQDVREVTLALHFEATAERLLGKRWQSIEFPIFHNLPTTPEVSSFRPYESLGVAAEAKTSFTPDFAKGWILRIDARVQSDERLKAEKNGEHAFVTHTYVPKLQDAVCVVRYWSTPHILEIRIPNFSSRESVTGLRDGIIAKFGKHFHFNDFEEWEMPSVCTSLLQSILERPATEPTLRRISGSLLRERDNSTMKIEIENQEESDLRDTRARTQSVNAYLKEHGVVESLIALFRLSDAHPEIRVVIGTEDINELAVRKTIRGKELDHVIFRLYSHSERNS